MESSVSNLKLADNFSALDCRERLVNTVIDVLADETNGSVSQHELRPPGVIAAEVIQMCNWIVGYMIG